MAAPPRSRTASQALELYAEIGPNPECTPPHQAPMRPKSDRSRREIGRNQPPAFVPPGVSVQPVQTRPNTSHTSSGFAPILGGMAPLLVEGTPYLVGHTLKLYEAILILVDMAQICRSRGKSGRFGRTHSYLFKGTLDLAEPMPKLVQSRPSLVDRPWNRRERAESER